MMHLALFLSARKISSLCASSLGLVNPQWIQHNVSCDETLSLMGDTFWVFFFSLRLAPWFCCPHVCKWLQNSPGQWRSHHNSFWTHLTLLSMVNWSLRSTLCFLIYAVALSLLRSLYCTSYHRWSQSISVCIWHSALLFYVYSISDLCFLWVGVKFNDTPFMLPIMEIP